MRKSGFTVPKPNCFQNECVDFFDPDLFYDNFFAISIHEIDFSIAASCQKVMSIGPCGLWKTLSKLFQKPYVLVTKLIFPKYQCAAMLMETYLTQIFLQSQDFQFTFPIALRCFKVIPTWYIFSLKYLKNCAEVRFYVSQIDLLPKWECWLSWYRPIWR